jgi:hypothetical protein
MRKKVSHATEKRRIWSRAYYAKNIEQERAKARRSYHRRRAKNPELFRQKWAYYAKRKWANRYEYYLERSRIQYKRDSLRPEIIRKRRQWARAYYFRKKAANPNYWREWYQRYYKENKERIQARQKKSYYDKKVERILNDLDVQVDLLCEKKCGRETLHPSGVCQSCRTSTCKKCKKVLVAKYVGQRLHDKCLPKGSTYGFE